MMSNNFENELEDELREEYDLSQLKGEVRGKYFERFQQGNNLEFLYYLSRSCRNNYKVEGATEEEVQT